MDTSENGGAHIVVAGLSLHLRPSVGPPGADAEAGAPHHKEGLPWGLLQRGKVRAQPRSSRGHGPPPAQAVIHVSHKPPVTSWLVVFLPVQYRSGAANTESSDSQLHSLVGVKKNPSCSFHIFYLFLGNWKTIFIREKFVSMTIKVSARGKCHISRK